jgi:hypothetical protein
VGESAVVPGRRIKRFGAQTSPTLPSVTATKGGLAKGTALVDEENILVGIVFAPEERG